MNFDYELIDVEELVLGIRIKTNPLIKGNYIPLELCLTEDVRDYDFILTQVDEVLNCNKLNGSYGGDITHAEFDKNKTVVSYEESTNSDPSTCTLPTWLFREIVDVWLKEAKKHFEETHKEE